MLPHEVTPTICAALRAVLHHAAMPPGFDSFTFLRMCDDLFLPEHWSHFQQLVAALRG
jgi:hypothetical protein